MTKTRKASPAQLAALAAGRAKAKALRDQTPAPVTLDFVQIPQATGQVEILDHAQARARLKASGLGSAQLPGRGKAIKLGPFTITNAKGKFSFASDAAPAPQPKAELTREMVLAWLTQNGLKL